MRPSREETAVVTRARAHGGSAVAHCRVGFSKQPGRITMRFEGNPAMHRLIGMAIALVVGLGVASAAHADSPGRRVALVIGNGAYVTTGSLKNPVSDAALISQALKRSGFEVVDTQDNLGVGPFRAALRKFQSDADGAQAAVVYYAGHGIEARGKN